MNYVVDKVKEEQKEDVSILTHPQLGKDAFMWLSCHITVKDELDCIGSLFFF